MIVRLFRPPSGGDDWLLYAPHLPGEFKGVRVTPELAAMMDGPSGYFYAEPKRNGEGWTISGPAPDQGW